MTKKSRGKLNYPMVGAQGIGELHSDLVKRAIGWDYSTVPYIGNSDRLKSLMAGEIHFAMISATDAVIALESRRVCALGISTLRRSPQLQSIPIMDDAGTTGFKLTAWSGLFAQAGTPAPILAKLSADPRRVLAKPDVVETIEGRGN